MILSNIIKDKVKLFQRLDPNRIYVENIRSFFGLPFKVARFFCEMAVKQKYFTKKIGIICPNDGRIIMSVDSREDIPEKVVCEHCQFLELNESEFSPQEKDLIEFYKLTEKQWTPNLKNAY